MNLKVQMYVRYMGESGDLSAPVKVQSRRLEGLSIPPSARSFRFYDVLEAVVKHEGKDARMVSEEALNLSPVHLIGADILTKAQLGEELREADPDKLKELFALPFDRYIAMRNSHPVPGGTIEASLIVPYDETKYVVVQLRPKTAG